jgi:hypothetical protein
MKARLYVFRRKDGIAHFTCVRCKNDTFRRGLGNKDQPVCLACMLMMLNSKNRAYMRSLFTEDDGA